MTLVDTESTLITQLGLGALLGSAVGDALGAPFEFQARGTFRNRFQHAVHGGTGEMIGGGAFSWRPGEFTDDTQMALALAESLIERAGSFDPATTWGRFVAWAHGATDIGLTTDSALAGTDWRTAAEEAHLRLGRTGSNGSLMRVTPISIAGALHGTDWTLHTARAQSRLTHHDEVAADAAAIAAEVIRRLVTGRSFAEATTDLLSLAVSPRSAELSECVSPLWAPDQDDETANSEATVCLAQALWAVRSTTSFEAAVTAAVNLGGDADTVAAVTGAIAGARYGIQEIPARWSSAVHGSVRQPDKSVRRYGQRDIQSVAHALMGTQERPMIRAEAPVGPTPIDQCGLFAANLAGAQRVGRDVAVVSLCRVDTLDSNYARHREIFMIDGDAGDNPNLLQAVDDAVQAIDAFLDEGFDVVVHCHGGRSRTGLVLKAWYMRRHGVHHSAAHNWLASVWPLYSTWNSSFTSFLDHDWSTR